MLYISFDYLESTTEFRSINTCTDILSTVAILINLMSVFKVRGLGISEQ